MPENKTTAKKKTVKQTTNRPKYKKIEDIFRLNSNRFIIQKELAENINIFKPDDVAIFILSYKAKSEDLEQKVYDLENAVIDLQEEINELENE